MKFEQITVLIGLILSLIACQSPKTKVITPAFYHWQHKVSLSEMEKQALIELKVQKMYVHFFDVDWDEAEQKTVALATIYGELESLRNQKIIPSVFITNRCIAACSDSLVGDLAEKIRGKIAGIAEKYQLKIEEIQLDCDWSEKTGAKYFELLKKVKQISPALPQISATIRLHQVKYFKKTGVPPVDRGMLMFYNVADVRNNTTQNSILDWKEAEKYLQNFDTYPLALDVALPIFSWGVVTRYGKLVNLLTGFSLNERNQAFFTQIAENQYKVIKSHYENGVYLYSDDVIRIEKVAAADLEKAQAKLFPLIKNTEMTVSFFDLSELNLRNHSISGLKNLLN
ncbi:MAG: hypothetical protein ACKVTZ_06220 [Bacteroidia bacterium]